MRKRTGKIIDSTIVLAGGLVLLAEQSETPAGLSTYLRDRVWLHYAILIAVGVFGAVTPVEAFAARAQQEKHRMLQRRFLIGLGRFILLAQRRIRPQVDLADVGLHTWVVKRTWKHPFSGVLTRTETYRIGGNPLTVSHFAPTKGQGVVGLCWKYNRESNLDVEALAAKLTTPADFERYREHHGGDAVMNFSWAEFQEVKHRGAVFAAPIRDGNRFIGCISTDCCRGYDALVS